jgi:hypothetical protein
MNTHRFGKNLVSNLDGLLPEDDFKIGVAS